MNTSSENQFYITLQSNITNELIQNNTSTHFTNILNPSIHLDYKKHWKVCLQYINFGKPVEGIVKIWCSCLHSDYKTSLPYLSVFSVNNSQEYYPEGNEYFDIPYETDLNSITIILTDENGKFIKNCDTTLLRLKFKSMAKDYYEYQTLRIENPELSDPSNFKVSLPSELNRDGTQNPWDVALTRVNVKPKDLLQFPYLGDSMYMVILHDIADEVSGDEYLPFDYIERMHKPEKYGISEKNRSVNYFKTNKIQGNRVTKEELMKFLNQNMFIMLMNKSEQQRNTNFINLDNNRTHLKAFFTNMAVSMPKELLRALGFTNMWHDHIHPKNGVVGWTHSYDSSRSESSADMTFYKTGQKSVMVYSDCVEKSYTGASKESFLTSFLLKTSEPCQTIEPKNIEFHRALNTDFSNISFQLIDLAYNKPLKFEKNSKSIISLLLRRKKLRK